MFCPFFFLCEMFFFSTRYTTASQPRIQATFLFPPHGGNLLLGGLTFPHSWGGQGWEGDVYPASLTIPLQHSRYQVLVVSIILDYLSYTVYIYINIKAHTFHYTKQHGFINCCYDYRPVIHRVCPKFNFALFSLGESSKYSRMLISSMVFFLILLSGVQHDFLNLFICCKESLIPPNRNVVCTVLRYLKTIRGSCLNPWELFESGWCSDRNRHGPRPKRFAFAIWTINPFHFLSDIFKCEEIKIGSNNYPRVSLVELSPIFKRFIHPKNTHSW